jgi:hypothetical protein
MRRFMVVAVRGRPEFGLSSGYFSVALLRCRCSGCSCSRAEKLQLHPTITHQSLANPSKGVDGGTNLTPPIGCPRPNPCRFAKTEATRRQAARKVDVIACPRPLNININN